MTSILVSDGLPVAEPSTDSAFVDQLRKLTGGSTELSSQRTELARAFGQAGKVAVVAFLGFEQGRITLLAQHNAGQRSPVAPDALRHFLSEHGLTACSRAATGTFSTGVAGWSLVIAPVPAKESITEALAVLVASSAVREIEQQANLAAFWWAMTQEVRHGDALRFRESQLAALLELQRELMESDNLTKACRHLSHRIQGFLGARGVVIGLCRRLGGACQLESFSNAEKLDKYSELGQAAEAALDEVILHNELTECPSRAETGPETRANERLRTQAGVPALVGIPIRDAEGLAVGGLILVGGKELQGSDATRFLQTVANQLSPQLLSLRANRVRLALQSFQRRLQQSSKRQWVLGIAAGILAVMMLPKTYFVKSDCHLQPVVRRFVAAPFEATLAESLAGPGKVVRQGQVLARIDGREIKWQLEGVVVDHDRARKKYDSALASGKVADAQLAGLEMERLSLKKKLLEERIQQLEIKSPISGIVLSGDLERAEGAPLQLGQTLFEVGPLEAMIVELEITPEDIMHVSAGSEVTFSLDAYPAQTWSGSITRIHPRARIVETEQRFLAEIEIQQQEFPLHPGMKGRARIRGPRRSLAWNLFHKPWSYLVRSFNGF